MDQEGFFEGKLILKKRSYPISIELFSPLVEEDVSNGYMILALRLGVEQDFF